ncbi:hypothetical protein HOP38_02625 [Vibrio mediterranei]|uniref:hypothetical protein n=1 Tax=Vibrio mediterranei TaxID=689 RepID=UPI001819C537|nr:hypothetical protein [Vibrio mediterranei]NUW71405.1 hypothetical protein [Vibrio mediterranei]
MFGHVKFALIIASLSVMSGSLISNYFLFRNWQNEKTQNTVMSNQLKNMTSINNSLNIVVEQLKQRRLLDQKVLDEKNTITQRLDGVETNVLSKLQNLLENEKCANTTIPYSDSWLYHSAPKNSQRSKAD